jgi:hypothetical protein
VLSDGSFRLFKTAAPIATVASLAVHFTSAQIGTESEDIDLWLFDSNETKVIGDFVSGARISDIGLSYLALRTFLEAGRPLKGVRGLFLGGGIVESRIGIRSNALQNFFKHAGAQEAFWGRAAFLAVYTTCWAGVARCARTAGRRNRYGKSVDRLACIVLGLQNPSPIQN